MKFTKLIAFIMAAMLLTLSLASCSNAYKNPSKYVNVPNLKDVVINQTDINDSVADSIDEILESEKDQYFDDTEETAVITKGDKVTITYTAVLTNTELNAADFSDLKGEGKALIIGDSSASINKTFPTAYSKDNTTAKGFEEQLMGAKKGDKLTIKCRFADDYSGTTLLKGEEVTYTVTVDKIERITVSKDHSITVAFTPVNPDKQDAMDAIKDIIISADKEEDKTQSDSHETTAPATTTAKPSGTDIAPIAKSFEDLFKSGSLSISFTEKDGAVKFEKETTAFSTIYDLGDLDPAFFLDKNLFYKFAVALTVTEDMVKANSSFEHFKGRDVYFTFEITKTSILPEWTDEFVKDYTNDEYEKVADYEKELEKNAIRSLAFDAIVEATEVISFPDTELEDYYNDTVDTLVLNALREADPSFTKLSDYTQAQIDELISEEEYQKIWTSAIIEAKANLKERLVIERLFEILDISLSKSEYKTKLQEEYNNNFYYYYYYYFGTSFTQSQLENMFGKDYWTLQFKYAKMFELLNSDVITINDDVKKD